MILPGSTAFTKTLGQQSDAIYTTNLVGNWDPTLGINAGYWANQVASGKHLRRMNGITHSTTDPDHFLLDGSDDFLGPAASGGYGGTPFTFHVENAWTVALWVKYNNVNTVLWVAGDGDDYWDVNIITSDDIMFIQASDGDDNWHVGSGTSFPFLFSDDTWYYVATTFDGSKTIKTYVNGSFNGSWILDTVFDSGESPNWVLNVGGGEVLGYVSGAGTKIGHVHVYTTELGSSQLRQNFLATHKMNSDRIYGNTYTA